MGASGAPRLWDELPDNILIETLFGDASEIDAVFADAAHTVSMHFDIGRVTGVPMEPRAVLGAYDEATGRYTVYAGSGGVVRQKREIAAVLGVEAADIRVVAFDVGGNFGTRNRVYVEFPLVAWASRKLGRPVKYTAMRGESFISDYQGRDLRLDLELADLLRLIVLGNGYPDVDLLRPGSHLGNRCNIIKMKSSPGSLRGRTADDKDQQRRQQDGIQRGGQVHGKNRLPGWG